MVELPIDNEPVVYLDFTPDGSVLIGMTRDGQIYCRDTGSWELLAKTNFGAFGGHPEVVLDPA